MDCAAFHVLGLSVGRKGSARRLGEHTFQPQISEFFRIGLKSEIEVDSYNDFSQVK